MLRDLRLGVRNLIAQPIIAAAAIGSLALGIGLNVAIFSVVNAVLLRGQPLQRADRLVEIYSGLSKEFPQAHHFVSRLPGHRARRRRAGRPDRQQFCARHHGVLRPRARSSRARP